jgi:hypothetical protein
MKKCMDRGYLREIFWGMRRIKAYRFYRKVAFNLYLFRQSLRISLKRGTCDMPEYPNFFMALKTFDKLERYQRF